MERYQLIGFIDESEKVCHKESELKVPTREQVEKWKGEWIVKHDGFNEITITECSKCEDEMIYESFFEDGGSNFCPHCGAAMTDEAVEIMIERLSGIK